MITRIEIDGFKTFQDFAVDMAPFQVIIGANGCGKSNFFDALDLLSKLASSDLRTAFKGVRGDINELFTVLPDNKSAESMRFAVEMLTNTVEHYEAKDNFTANYIYSRYELEVKRRETPNGFEQLYVSHEHLLAKPVSANKLEQKPSLHLRGAEFDTEAWDVGSFGLENATVHADGTRTVHVKAEVRERKQNDLYSFAMNEDTDKFHERSLLCEYSSSRYPHLQTVQQELQNLKLLRLDTEKLRHSSSYLDAQELTSTGENLPATLARMQTQDKHLLKDVSRDVANIVPNFALIEVDRDEGRKHIALYANMRDKRRFSIEALSEGTLRILALATLHNDPQLQGTLCFEDPEMGVHPGALKRIVNMLRSMATDLNDLEDLKLPLRQVLVTTHSPELVSELNIEGGELLFATMVTRVVPQNAAWQVTRMTPVCSDNTKGPDQIYALSHVIQYLSNPDVAAKRDSLREVFAR